MRSYFLPLSVLVVCYVIFLAVVGLSYEALPVRVASHFDAAGQPNGWMSREEAVEFILCQAILVPGFVIGITALSNRLPDRYINIPKRDRWMTPEGRAKMRVILMRAALWFGSMMVLFLTGLHVLVVVANLEGGAQLNMGCLGTLTFCFLAGTVIWLGGLLLRLLRPS